jgi:hypothetical protein
VTVIIDRQEKIWQSALELPSERVLGPLKEKGLIIAGEERKKISTD